jgi:hypothetical protein
MLTYFVDVFYVRQTQGRHAGCYLYNDLVCLFDRMSLLLFSYRNGTKCQREITLEEFVMLTLLLSGIYMRQRYKQELQIQVFKKELCNGNPNVTVWRVLRKRLQLKAYKPCIVQHLFVFVTLATQ